MRPLALAPAICALIALILVALCLSSGRRPGYLDNYHLVLLNTSHIALDFFNTTADGGTSARRWDPSPRDGPSLNLTEYLQNITNSFQDGAADGINNAIQELTHASGIADFYTLHLQNSCWGYNNGSITGCKTTAFHHSTPGAALQKQLDLISTSLGLERNLTLNSINWPRELDDVAARLYTVFDCSFVLFCIATALLGLELLLSLGSIFSRKRWVSAVNTALFGTALAVFMTAAIMITISSGEYADEANSFGAQLSISAKTSSDFLGLVWSAFAMIVVGTSVWVFECLVDRRRVWSRLEAEGLQSQLTSWEKDGTVSIKMTTRDVLQ